MRNPSLAALSGALLIAAQTFAAPLTLESYLDQVARQNPGYQGSSLGSRAALAADKAGDLMFGTQFFSDLRYYNDPRTTMIPKIEGDRTERASASVGLRRQMDFGLQLQLAFDVNRTTLYGTDPVIVTDPQKTIFSVTPVFNLSLWQNLGGGLDRANRRLSEAQARASSYGNAYQAKAILVDAEARYWKLAALREAIRVEQESLDRALAIRDLNEKKFRRQLVDEPEVLIARAAVQGKQLELRSMRGEEASAARQLNAARGADSAEVGETLTLPDVDDLRALSVPERAPMRGDVQAAQQGLLAATAGSEVARQKLLPAVNLYGSVYAIGVNLAVPLDFGTVSEARAAYADQGKAAELNFRRQTIDDASDWKDLQRRFGEAKERLQIALELERVQKLKYESVRRRQKNGLTIAYQVFQYELDYLNAALNRVQIAGLILGLHAQMKLYAAEAGAR